MKAIIGKDSRDRQGSAREEADFLVQGASPGARRAPGVRRRLRWTTARRQSWCRGSRSPGPPPPPPGRSRRRRSATQQAAGATESKPVQVTLEQDLEASSISSSRLSYLAGLFFLLPDPMIDGRDYCDRLYVGRARVDFIDLFQWVSCMAWKTQLVS